MYKWRGEIQQMAAERPSYPPAYAKRVLEVTGQYDRMLNSPRFLLRSTQANAKLEWQKMQLDFPSLANSGAGRATTRLNNYSEELLVAINLVDRGFEARPHARNGDLLEDAKVADQIVTDIRELIRSIQNTLLTKPVK